MGKTNRNSLVGALATVALALAGCEAGEKPQLPADPNAGDYPGIEELASPVTALAQPCTWATGAPAGSNGTVTITVDADEVAILAKSTSNTNILVNGQTCSDGTTTATTANTKIINVVEGTSGAQTLIVDYSPGALVNGTATATHGIHVDLGGTASDALKVRGAAAAETFTFGKTTGGAYAIAVNTDAYPDIYADDTTNTAFVLSAGKGADTIDARGKSTYGLPSAWDLALTVYGGDDADKLYGSTAADTMYGGEGADTLDGQAGADTMYGEGGADTFSMGAATDGNDVIYGGTTNPAATEADLVDYSARTTTVTVTLDGVADSGEAGETDDIDNTVENVKTGAGDDDITGSAAANTIYSGAGADTIAGGDGNDKLYGEAGNDTFDEGATANGEDTFTGGTGTDVVDYSGRSLALVVTIEGTANDGESAATEKDNVTADVENVLGGSADDSITGSASDNRLEGGAGADTLKGGGGNDVLVGGTDTAADKLYGEAGDDRLVEDAATSGADEFWGGLGVDTVDYSARTAAITVTMAGDGLATASATNNDGGSAGAEADNVQNDVENLLCPATAACTVTGNALDNEIVGGSANDTINGGLGNDTLDGATGTDNDLDGDEGDGDICMNKGASGSYTDCEL